MHDDLMRKDLYYPYSTGKYSKAWFLQLSVCFKPPPGDLVKKQIGIQ